MLFQNTVNIEILELLTKADQDHQLVRMRNKDGYTALHLAVAYKQIEVLEHLLKPENADKEMLNTYGDGYTALHMAMQYQLPRAVELLLEADQDKELVMKTDIMGDTALHCAVHKHFLNGMSLLINADHDNNILRMPNVKTLTALHLAMHYQYLDMVEILAGEDKELLRMGDANDNTVLHLAVKKKDEDAVKLLLTKAENDRELLCKRNKDGYTALHLAIRIPFLNAVNLLIEADTERKMINMVDKKKNTALHLAVRKKHLEFVKCILTAAGQDREFLYKLNNDGSNALHVAMENQQLDIVDLLIETDQLLVRKGDINENTALHLAVKGETLEAVIRLLTKAGHDKELLCMVNKDGNTALHLGIIEDHLEALELLINADLDRTMVKIKNKEFKTAFHLAVEHHQIEVVKTLCAANLGEALVGMRDADNNTVLHLAVTKNDIEVVDIILTQGDPMWNLAMITNNQKETALQLAIRMQFLPIARLFIQVYPKDVLVGMLDENKNTILHLAVQSRNIEIVKVIGVGNKELVTICNEQNNTALHTAVQNPFLEAVQFLIRADSDYNYGVNKAGKTPLYTAVENGSTDFVKEILDECPNPTYGGPNGDTALRKALISENSDIRKWLLEKQRHQCEVQGVDGWTPLQYAASVGSLSGVKDIIESFPACSKVVDGYGRNFIHIAATNRHTEVLKYASESNKISDTELNKKDNLGYTPFHISAETNIKELVEILLYNDRVIKKTKNANGEKALAGITFDYDKDRARAYSVRDKVNEKELQEQSAYDLLVCALISTLSFTAGITVPGGYNSDTEKPYKGRALLIGDQMFKAFVLSNTCALMFSLSALFSHFCTKRLLQRKAIRFYKTLATYCTLLALFSMMVAFITGSFTVLSVSKGLAFAVLGICSVFIIFALSTMIYMMLENKVPTT